MLILVQVLGDLVRKEEISEVQAVGIVAKCLYDNAVKVYEL